MQNFKKSHDKNLLYVTKYPLIMKTYVKYCSLNINM